MVDIPEFDRIGNKWVADALKSPPSSIPDVLYHYTDAAGLVGVLRSGKLWATETRFLNDIAERLHTKELVKSFLIETISSADEIGRKVCESILRYQALDTDEVGFIFSLSAERDDLSQWRGYANDGIGFTIGFSGSGIYDAAQSSASDFTFSKVEYSQETQIGSIKKCFKEVDRALRQKIEKDDSERAMLINEVARVMDMVIENRAIVNKHPSFKGENEWRVVLTRAESTPIQVRTSGLRLVPYVEFSPTLSDGDKLPIEAIGIGPGFKGPEQLFAIRALCRETGYDPNFYFANTPYRRLGT